jgi:HSP20 family molecular chaperone IbpA
MERLQEEIDRAIRNATEQFSSGPGAGAFRADAGYSSSFDLRDRNDHFELRAYLPDLDAADVNVKIDNDRTLHISANQKKQEVKKNSAGEESVTELGQFEQLVTLPEPVRGNDMKVERNGHEVIINIPKATHNAGKDEST